MIGLKQKIDQHLDVLIPFSKRPLLTGARYSLFAPSKRIRPLLTLMTGKMLGATEDALLPAACALELVHTYSMIHDDLPCMDDDDYRRGQSSLHCATSEAVAVLVGDYLLTHAFSVIANAPLLSDAQKVALIQVLSTRAGGCGMVQGQMMDLAAEDKKVSLKTLQTIHANKTGALIVAAIQFGTIIAQAKKSTAFSLAAFGQRFGLMFQIIDDILDVTHAQEKHGTPLSSDQKNHKSTYVTLMGLQEAKKHALRLNQKATDSLKALPYDTTALQNLCLALLKKINF